MKKGKGADIHGRRAFGPPSGRPPPSELLRRAELDHEDEPAPRNGNGSGAAAPQEEAENLRFYTDDFRPKIGDVLAGYLNRS
jgi:hypothetical protein